MRNEIDRSVPRTTLLGLCALSGSALLLEIGLTRLLSVTLWYHFAFFIVSSALLGFCVSGVVLGLRRDPSIVSDRLIVGSSLASPVAMFVGFALFNAVPLEPLALGESFHQWIWLLLCVLLAAAPFFAVGLTIAALLTRYAHEVHRLYLYDLVGAGLGSFTVVFSMSVVGGVGTVVVASAIAAVGAALVCATLSKRAVLGSLALTSALCAVMPVSDVLLPLRISQSKTIGAGRGARPAAQVLADPQIRKLTLWNTLSRLDVLEHPDGRDPRRKARTIAIDGGTAFTRLARPDRPIDELLPTDDEQSFFYKLRSPAHLLVVGSGGGFEVLLAVHNGVNDIEAIEINPGINRIVTKDMAWFTGRLYEHPRVRWHTDEARSFLRRSDKKYNVIQCPHTISNAALSSGSLGLSENYLLTREAFADFFSHLSPGGVLLVTRPQAHLPRLVSTARRTLVATRGADTDTRRMALVWRTPQKGSSFFAGAAFCPDGFEPETVERFVALSNRLGLEVLYAPETTESEPYAALLRGKLDETSFIEAPQSSILVPATDDMPFFNQRVPLSRLGLADLAAVFSGPARARESLEDRPVAEAALLALLLEVAGVGLLLIVGPLLWARSRALSGVGVGATLATFFALGLAFIVVEMGLVQRFALYLGKPIVLMSTVFGGLLIASGMGAGASKRWSGSRWNAVAPFVAGSLVLALSVVIPLVTRATLAWPEPLRVIVSLALIAPLGLVMGMPFPLLLGRLDRAHRERIPWAYGVNGLASVVGTIFAVILGMASGYGVVTWVGAGCYFAAGVFAARRWE